MQTKSPMSNVVLIETDNLMDFAQGINIKNQSLPIDADGKKITWLQIHEFRYDLDSSLIDYLVQIYT